MEACDAIYYPMKNKKSNTALKMRKRRRLGAFIFVVVLLALAVVAVRIYNMNKPSRDAELLTLVNPWNTIPDGYEPQLCTLSDGQQIDRRCYDDLMRMLDDCRAAGNSPYICSAYRTWDKQQALFDNKIQRLENEGMDADTARVEAAKVVAVPGTSEHQLGLALDIIDTGYTNLDEGRRTPPRSSGSWRTVGTTASSCATPTARRTSPASSMSRGTTDMWAAPPPRRYTSLA